MSEEQQQKKEYCDKIEENKKNRFYQQTLDSYRPKVTTRGICISFTLVGAFCIFMGSMIQSSNSKAFESVIRYDDKCQDKLNMPKNAPNRFCDVTIEL